MLPAHPILDNGLAIIIEFPHIRTNARVHTGDLDVSASYPNGEVVFNISKATCHRELLIIHGVTEYERRMQGINLSSGAVNAIEIGTSLLGMPTLNQMLNQFMMDEALILENEK